jgi:predicted esterase YcpF (UPF0227 family)
MIVYLHGLNSSSGSAKAQRLKEALAPTPVLAPDYRPHRPMQAVAELTEYLQGVCSEHGPPVLVGSSMGGFYGRWLVRSVPCVHLVMINPALRPWAQLRDYIGREQCTVHGECYVITREMMDETRALTPAAPCEDLPVPTTLLLDLGDELIDQRASASMYRGCARVVTFPDGDHGFAHLEEGLDVIRAAVADRQN